MEIQNGQGRAEAQIMEAETRFFVRPYFSTGFRAVQSRYPYSNGNQFKLYVTFYLTSLKRILVNSRAVVKAFPTKPRRVKRLLPSSRLTCPQRDPSGLLGHRPWNLSATLRIGVPTGVFFKKAPKLPVDYPYRPSYFS